MTPDPQNQSKLLGTNQNCMGTNQNCMNLQPHPGFVWVKPGYSEAIAWRKVRLTELTTDGLWAMPLNTGWVPKGTQAAGLREIEEICPNGFPALVERDNNGDNSNSE